MPLSSGARLGPYEILAPLGAGGMGEVYRARDSRLARTVAIKVLPAGTAAQPEVRQRFEREARAVSALNHPNICTLYDVGEQDGIDFIVMEYLEGESLADRLKKGPLPLDQALRIAREVADALDRAHRTGITHRDLKPANIMLIKDGAKVLDFGLAKMREQGAVAGAPGSMLQTMTSPLTGQGSIIGTLQYMAPEQLEGREADARSDLFAFGAVLYEMVTGRRAFDGASQASLIACILEREPVPLAELQPAAPALLDRLVRSCLAKDPDQRRQTARDVLLDLKWIAEPASGIRAAAAITAPPAAAAHRNSPWIAAILVAALLSGAAVWFFARPRPAPAPTVRLDLALPAGTSFGGSWWWPPSVAISPDGTRVAYVATRDNGAPQVWLRDLSEPEGRPLDGTSGADSPVFSPDGHWLLVRGDGKLLKIPLAGGSPVTVAAVSSRVIALTWAAGDIIYFGGVSPLGLQKVPASGGTPQPVTKLDPAKRETDHGYPQALPGGKTLLFVVRHASQANFDEADIEALVLATGERRKIVGKATDPHFVAATGHLVFLRAGVLLAAPFDAGKLALTGEPLPVVESVIENPRVGAGQFAISETGSLVYLPGGVTYGEHELVFVDRTGATRVLTAKRRPYEDFSISPDGRFLAATIEGPNTDTWIHDIARDTDTRFTFGVEHRDPAWSADGKRIFYDGYKDGKYAIFSKPLDGGAEEQLLSSDLPIFPWFWSRDGSAFVYASVGSDTQSDVYVLPAAGGQPRPVLATRFDEDMAQLSPDGHWIAYSSDDSGRPEIYVAAFPSLGSRVRVSTEGGLHPQWSPDGRELYYRVKSGSVREEIRQMGQHVKLMAVPVETAAALKTGTPHMLFEGPFFDSGHDYAVTPDGKGFIFIRESPSAAAGSLKVVLHWLEELKRRF